MFQALAAATGALKVGGAIAGAIGAKQRAGAIKEAFNDAIKGTKDFTKDQVKRSEDLGKTKQDFLETGDPLLEMGKFMFGDASSSTLSNLRKAQSDFAALAAGDTSGFSKEVSNIVRSSLANTFGGPRGSFENTSAKNLFAFRQGGMQSAMGLTDFFNRAGSQLTNAKFGILDQTFNQQLALRQNELSQINNFRFGKAETAGVGWMGVGNVMNAAAGALSGFGTSQSNATALADQKAFGNNYLRILGSQTGLGMNAQGIMTPMSGFS